MPGTQPDDGNPRPQFPWHDCAQKQHIETLSRQVHDYFQAMEQRDKDNAQQTQDLIESINTLCTAMGGLEVKVKKREWTNGVQNKEIKENKKNLAAQEKIVVDLAATVKSLNLVAKLNALLLGGLIVAVLAKVFA